MMRDSRKGRWIVQTLILSLLLNALLGGLFFYFFMREHSMKLLFAYQPVESSASISVEALQPDHEGMQSLLQSPEFTLVRTLFARSEHEISRKLLVKLILEGNDSLLEEFYSSEQQRADFSPSVRQKFLLSYLDEGSPTAAYLLVKTDLEFALLQPDSRLIEMLSTISEEDESVEAFAVELIEAERSEEVTDKALQWLLEHGREEIAARYDRYPNTEKLRPLFRQQVPITQTRRTHVVQPGESLWLIAKKYNVSIEKIMVTNNLRSTTLQTGQMLKIPAK